MTKIAGSGSISQRYVSADPDPDPLQNVMDPEHCFIRSGSENSNFLLMIGIFFTFYHREDRSNLDLSVKSSPRYT
jgi:hypothetical protein